MRGRFRAAAGMALIAAALLSGCSGPVAGEVVDKDIRGAYTQVTMMPCGQGCMTPLVTHIPECRRLHVEDESDGKIRRVCVGRQEWEATEVGTRFESENYEKDES